VSKRSSPSSSKASGRFAYEGLERVIHEKARLGILTSLVAHPEGLAFGDLKELCSLTDGNLNRHLKMLADAGLVHVRRESTRSRPQTICQLTSRGRARFLEYLEELERVVADAAARNEQAATARKPAVRRARPVT